MGSLSCSSFYMKRLIENMAFEQIYHEHLLYYNLENVEVLLNRHGLALFDAYLGPDHGGSIIGFAAHAGRRTASERLLELRRREVQDGSDEISTYKEFAKRIEQMKDENVAYLSRAKKLRKRIYGMGAPVKGNTLPNYFRVGKQYIECLVEKNELWRGLHSPGMHIPIVIENELRESQDIYYVLAWNFRKEILANNRDLFARGVEFHFPVNPADV
jgi:hypothetical protein